MSRQAIQEYYTNLDRAVQFAKTRNEDTIKSYFWMLLNQLAHGSNYEVVREVFCKGTKGAKVKPDGIVRNLWGLDVGYWESKDEKDNIQDEIDAKIKKDIPLPIFFLKTVRQQSCINTAKKPPVFRCGTKTSC